MRMTRRRDDVASSPVLLAVAPAGVMGAGFYGPDNPRLPLQKRRRRPGEGSATSNEARGRAGRSRNQKNNWNWVRSTNWFELLVARSPYAGSAQK